MNRLSQSNPSSAGGPESPSSLLRWTTNLAVLAIGGGLLTVATPIPATLAAESTDVVAPTTSDVRTAARTTSGAAREMLSNGSFGRGREGWVAPSPTSFRVVRLGVGRSNAARLTSTRHHSAEIRSVASDVPTTVQADRFTASASVRSKHPRQQGRLVVQVIRRSKVVREKAVPFTLASRSWSRVSTSVAAPAEGASMRVVVRLAAKPHRSTALVDNVSLRSAEPTAAATPVPSPTSAPAAPQPVLANALETLLNTTFDRLPLGPMTADGYISVLGGSDRSTATYDDASVVPDSRGGKAMRVTLDPNTIRTSPSGNNGFVSIAKLPRVLQNACLSYDVKFDSRFDWSMGGKLPGLIGVAPGVNPGMPTGGRYAGDLGWSGRVMWRGPKPFNTLGQPNMAISYMYSPLQKDQYGDNISWNSSFVAGKWHTVKQCFTMNTVGKADGVLRGYLDGTLVLQRNDFVFRTRTDVGISHLAWSIFRGGNTMDWASLTKGTVDLNRVVVTTN